MAAGEELPEKNPNGGSTELIGSDQIRSGQIKSNRMDEREENRRREKRREEYLSCIGRLRRGLAASSRLFFLE